MEANYLGKLQRGRPKGFVCVRIMRKWTVRETMGQRTPLYVALVLADTRGGTMYAEIPQEIIHTVDSLLQVGNTYLISRFRVTPAKTCYKPFSAHLMIEFTEFTSIKLAQNSPETFPKYVYTLTSFEKIVPAQGPVPILTDVLGYIAKYTSVTTITPKGKERASILREVFIKDMSDNELKITLWGDCAMSFTVDHLNSEENSKAVIALFVGCIPRKWHSHHTENKPYLSASSGCDYYLNPDIQEALPFYNRFKDQPMFIERPPPSENNIAIETEDTPLPHKTIAELDSIDPYDFPDEGYKCTVTVTQIADNISWWYMSCKSCKKKMDPQTQGGYTCPKCYGTDALPRYLLNFSARDETTEASFFAYAEVAKLMILRDCHLILNPLKSASGLPQPLQAVVSKKFTFSISLTEDSFTTRSRRQYLVKHILERSDRRHSALYLAGSSSSPQSIPSTTTTSTHKHAPLQIMNTPQANEQTPAAVINSADTHSPLQILDTPQFCSQTPAITIHPNKTDTKISDNRSSVPLTSTRKRLFTERKDGPKETTSHETLDDEVVEENEFADLTHPPKPGQKKRK